MQALLFMFRYRGMSMRKVLLLYKQFLQRRHIPTWQKTMFWCQARLSQSVSSRDRAQTQNFNLKY